MPSFDAGTSGITPGVTVLTTAGAVHTARATAGITEPVTGSGVYHFAHPDPGTLLLFVFDQGAGTVGASVWDDGITTIPARAGDAMTLAADQPLYAPTTWRDLEGLATATALAEVDTVVGGIAADYAKTGEAAAAVTGLAKEATVAALPSDADVQTAAAAALTAYDPPTRADATADKNTIIGAIPSASAIASAVWAATSRTLSSFGALAESIWAYATRSLTDKTGFSGAATNLPTDYAKPADVQVTVPTPTFTGTVNPPDVSAVTLAAVQPNYAPAKASDIPADYAKTGEAAAAVETLNDFDPATDVVAHVALVDTVTTLTEDITASTDLAPVLTAIADLPTDADVQAAAQAAIVAEPATLTAAYDHAKDDVLTPLAEVDTVVDGIAADYAKTGEAATAATGLALEATAQAIKAHTDTLDAATGIYPLTFRLLLDSDGDGTADVPAVGVGGIVCHLLDATGTTRIRESVTTDSLGWARWHGLAAGTYVVDPDDPAYEGVTVSVTIPE